MKSPSPVTAHTKHKDKRVVTPKKQKSAATCAVVPKMEKVAALPFTGFFGGKAHTAQ